MDSGYTAAQIATAIGIGKRAVHKRAAKEKWPSEVLNGRGEKSFIFKNLPEDIQKKMLVNITSKHFDIDNLSATLTADKYIYKDRVKELAEKFHINISPGDLDDPRVATTIKMACECMAVPKGARNRKAVIKQIAEGYGYNVGSAYRVMARIKAGKPIQGKPRAHGVHLKELGITLRAWDEKAARMAVGMILENKRRRMTALALYQVICDTAEAGGLSVGAYRSFLRLKKKITPALKAFRDTGKVGLRQDFIPPIRRDPTAYRPMECLVGDQHKADYYAFDSQGNVVTLELFCWMDFRTQLVWGSIAYKHYNRYTVGQALINAVRWGLPSTVYTDWGKPEKSNYISLLIKQLTGLGIKTEAIDHILATQRHPQAKPLEGFFGNFDRQLKNTGLSGYCKRLKDPREAELQQKELSRLIKSGGLLSTDELTEKIISEVEKWNIHLFKNRGQDNGLSPKGIYETEVKQYPVSTLSEDVLDWIFLPMRKLMIKRSQVAFKHEWLGRRVFYDRALADHQGCEAEVRYDPFDPWRVFVFVDGKFICEAQEWEMINPKVSDQVAGKMAEQKALAAQIEETYRKFLPPKAPVRRINPHEKQARQVKQQVKELRVMRTSLETGASGQGSGVNIAVVGGSKADALAEFRSRFHPGAEKSVEEKAYKPVFRLNMKQFKEG